MANSLCIHPCESSQVKFFKIGPKPGIIDHLAVVIEKEKRRNVHTSIFHDGTTNYIIGYATCFILTHCRSKVIGKNTTNSLPV